ncbi:MAG: NADPH:quinone reductase [Frankiales bacterium]|nr:NADPH:quinone reductase [Frankiales bacterium]
MRVVRQNELGGPEVLHVVQGPIPEPLPTEIRVRVHAAGVNPVDWKTRGGAGMVKAMGPLPFSVGWDVAGVVDTVGLGVSRFSPGDRVMGMPWFPRQAATYADYVTGPARQFVTIPERVDMLVAAATPLAATTAWQIVHDVAAIKPDDRVLIVGAGGGVGHIAVQLARLAGGVVAGVDAADKLPWLTKLGLHHGHDFRAGDFTEVYHDQDVVIDFLGGEMSVRALSVLRRGGLLVSVPSSGAGDGLEHKAAPAGVRVGRIIVEPDRVALEEVAARLSAGDLSVRVGATYPLDAVAEAHQAGEMGRVHGKIVLTVAD